MSITLGQVTVAAVLSFSSLTGFSTQPHAALQTKKLSDCDFSPISIQAILEHHTHNNLESNENNFVDGDRARIVDWFFQSNQSLALRR